MLAYSDSVYYYGQYTEAGSGSFLGATRKMESVGTWQSKSWQ